MNKDQIILDPGVDIPADVAQDVAGNGNFAAAQFQIEYAEE